MWLGMAAFVLPGFVPLIFHKNATTEMQRGVNRKKPGTSRRKQELLFRIPFCNLKSKYVFWYIPNMLLNDRVLGTLSFIVLHKVGGGCQESNDTLLTITPIALLMHIYHL